MSSSTTWRRSSSPRRASSRHPPWPRIARRLTETLAPDGHEPGYRDRIRHLTLHQRPDGSSSGSFELTAHATEALLTVLDATAAPRPSTAGPEADGVKDPRTAGQRRHDGLLDALLLTLRSEQLPTCNGVTTTILLTLTADQAATGTGSRPPDTARCSPSRKRYGSPAATPGCSR